MRKNFESNKEFNKKLLERVEDYPKNKKLKIFSKKFFEESVKNNYSYNFTWLDSPIIQYPQDLTTIQEIVYKIKPNVIIETGIARGGSVLFLASLLMLLDSEAKFNKKKEKFKLLSIDIQIRKEIKNFLKKHFLSKYFKLFESSSTSKNTTKFISNNTKKSDKVLLILDSNHTEEHVLGELLNFSNFVSKGSYIIVMDTAINFLSNKFHKDKGWTSKNNPKTAIDIFLKKFDVKKEFIIDDFYEKKSLITNCPSGFLKKIK